MVEKNETPRHSSSSVPTAESGRVVNIVSQKQTGITWDVDDPRASLAQLHDYVVGEALRSEAWYWNKKSPKARWSRTIQFSVIVLAALGGLFPIIVKLEVFQHLSASATGKIDSGLWASFFIGSAAAVLGLDRFFGFSSGWARYVLTGTNIRRTLEEYRMDWALMMAQLGSSPSPDQVSELANRAKEFRLAVEGLVFKETQDWVTEFQNNMAQLEMDLGVQVERLKAETEKTAQSRNGTNAPGALEAIINNADKTDHFRFQALLENHELVVVDDTVSNSSTLVKLGVPPGQYKLTVSAKVVGKPVSVSSVVVVKPNDIAKLAVTIPTS